MFCEHCGEENGDLTGVDHDERDCPWYETELRAAHAAAEAARPIAQEQ